MAGGGGAKYSALQARLHEWLSPSKRMIMSHKNRPTVKVIAHCGRQSVPLCWWLQPMGRLRGTVVPGKAQDHEIKG